MKRLFATLLTALAIGGIVGWSQVLFRPKGRLSMSEVSEGSADLVLAMVRTSAPPQKRKPST